MSRSLPLVLASRSPRRRELLTAAGYDFTVLPADESAECGMCSGEAPVQLVARYARQKAADVAARITEGLILACDTVAELDGQVFGKPAHEDHARSMLRSLRGREHLVHSGLCILDAPGGQPQVRTATTLLRMDALDDATLEEYLASGEWEGKAGAFGYQDRLGWVHIVRGSETNVVGLPMELLAEMLAQMP
jgi:septum formation protein